MFTVQNNVFRKKTVECETFSDAIIQSTLLQDATELLLTTTVYRAFQKPPWSALSTTNILAAVRNAFLPYFVDILLPSWPWLNVRRAV